MLLPVRWENHNKWWSHESDNVLITHPHTNSGFISNNELHRPTLNVQTTNGYLNTNQATMSAQFSYSLHNSIRMGHLHKPHLYCSQHTAPLIQPGSTTLLTTWLFTQLILLINTTSWRLQTTYTHTHSYTHTHTQ